MKKLSVFLAAALLSASVMAPENRPDPQFTMIEGFCAGAIIGVFTGTVIVIGYRCLTRPKQITQDTNSIPCWWFPPPPEFPATNSPATNIVAKTVTLDGSNGALSLLDISECPYGPFTNAWSTAIQASSDGGAFETICRMTGWVSSVGQLLVVADGAGVPILTNFGAAPNRIDLPLPPAARRLFRMVSTP